MDDKKILMLITTLLMLKNLKLWMLLMIKAEDNSLESTSSEVDVITGEEHKTDSSEQPVEIKKLIKRI